MITKEQAIEVAKKVIPDLEERDYSIRSDKPKSNRYGGVPDNCWFIPYSIFQKNSGNIINASNAIFIDKDSGEIVYNGSFTELLDVKLSPEIEISDDDLWKMIIDMYFWKYENENKELIEFLEGAGLLDEISQDSNLFLVTLLNMDGKKILSKLNYTIDELKELYRKLSPQIEDNLLGEIQIKKINEIILNVIEVLQV